MVGLLSLRCIAVVGLALFLPLFIYTFADPQIIERDRPALFNGSCKTSSTPPSTGSAELPKVGWAMR